jgi:hypothetical protein
MTNDNVIDLMSRLSPDGRRSQRDSNRNESAKALLNKLRSIARIEKSDRGTLVSNLGRLVYLLDPANPKDLAREIVGPDRWPKRKRYILLPNEDHDESSRCAASGADFATIIESLVDEKVSKGFERSQATTDTVYGTLKKTSFLPPSRFKLPKSRDAEAEYLIRQMAKVFEKLAQEADLSEYFHFISKYPIYPDDAWYQWCRSLELRPDLEPNNLYEWHEDADIDGDELTNWIAWWVPRCLIGHLYIPIKCKALYLSEQSVEAIKKSCGGTITHENWSKECSDLVFSLSSEQLIGPHVLFHRLPVWLMVLPLPDRLIPCFYVAIHPPGGFYPDEYSPLYNEAGSPCFVDELGERLSDDLVFFTDDDFDDQPTYVCPSDGGVIAVGACVEDHPDFKASFFQPSTIEDLPTWLHNHPVQSLLKLTMDSDAAKLFALSPRRSTQSPRDNETVFRPAFFDPRTQTPLPQNTIAAYLLRNFGDVEDASIFEALKKDAFTKANAAKEKVAGELSRFEAKFNTRYGP